MVQALSILLDNEYDIKLLTRSDGSVTFLTAADRDEVEQALRIRLLTRRGEDIFSVTTGLPIGAMIANDSIAFAVGSITSEILRDNRVEAVGGVTADLTPLTRVLRVSASVSLKDGSQLPISVPIGGV